MLNYIFEASGKSRSEAEEYTLKTLRLNPGDLKFETVDSGKSGFFGLKKSPAVVRAFINNNDIPSEKIIHGVVVTILEKMGIEAEVIGMGDVDGKIYVEIASDESGLIIGRKGATLDSLQFLLNLMIDPKLRHGRKIVLDIESYRDKREMALIRMGKSAAAAVIKSGKPKLLEPMNPFERRIIHMALQDHDKVFTKSDGNGTYKKVRIIPIKDKNKFNKDKPQNEYPDTVENFETEV